MFVHFFSCQSFNQVNHSSDNLQGAGFWVLGAGHLILGTGYWSKFNVSVGFSHGFWVLVTRT